MLDFPEKCLRDRSDCQPTAQLASDCGSSFVCCGERTNKPSERRVPGDRFTLCWKTLDGVDQMQFMDRYDMHSTIHVLSRALVMDDINPETEKND